MTIMTLTDVMMGSGESVPGIIDADVHYDDLGLPYMNAKTLKGHLREAMELILSTGAFPGLSADDLLGKPGQGSSGNQNAPEQRVSKVRLSEVHLPKSVIESVRSAEINGAVYKEEVLDSLTKVYTSTRIDEDTGTAAPHSLRKYRMIRKGLFFEALVTTEGLTEEEYALLEMSVRGVQHIGTLKSKGKGLVSCELR